VSSRDRRYDGVFYTAVRTTGIYCRPSCPARTPAPANVSFHASAASAQSAGYRACKRCLPDATPGSPDWDTRATVAGRAMRLIADGVVDREGVDGLARRVGYTSRHLGRVLTSELGAGPLALARARRAQTARVLIETTDLGLADVAFAAGFASVRQFNDTVREVYGATPSSLRAGRARGGSRRDGTITMRLAVRTPFAASSMWAFLAYHLVPGVEVAGPGWYSRTLDLPHGPGVLRLDLDPALDEAEPGRTAQVLATFTLADLRDTAAAVERARRLVDADCDPLAVVTHLGGDPVLGPLVARHPGLRVPGQVDGEETAIRTVIGQQVSVTGARTVTGRVVAAHGSPVETDVPGLTHLFPRTATLAGVDSETLPMPRARGRALVGLAAALASGEISLDRGPERDEVRARMLALRGIGPWTADYVAMRALAHPDVFLPTDVGVRIALTRLGLDPAAEVARSEAWRPWRSYALMHLWQTLMPEVPAETHSAAPARDEDD
jgi:AraC family transcriptional regulator of adaptative response / DNA-3-methyladenine glycosylase II